jgi:16S rRNA (uracil1498-N3)-methyltransferase
MFWTFVDAGQIADGQLTIEGKKGHHLARVLRVRTGERGTAVGKQGAYEVEVMEVTGERVTARLLSEAPTPVEPATSVTLLQAGLPNPDFDAVIEGGTQIGISRFVAVQADRSVSHPPAARVTRWRAIAESAAEQSHRGIVPVVDGPMTLSAAIDSVEGTRLLVLEPSAVLPLVGARDGSRRYAIATGPEGGWTGAELALLNARGGVAVNLGPRIMRARLAPIIAAAILVQQS